MTTWCFFSGIITLWWGYAYRCGICDIKISAAGLFCLCLKTDSCHQILEFWRDLYIALPIIPYILFFLITFSLVLLGFAFSPILCKTPMLYVFVAFLMFPCLFIFISIFLFVTLLFSLSLIFSIFLFSLLLSLFLFLSRYVILIWIKFFLNFQILHVITIYAEKKQVLQSVWESGNPTYKNKYWHKIC